MVSPPLAVSGHSDLYKFFLRVYIYTYICSLKKKGLKWMILKEEKLFWIVKEIFYILRRYWGNVFVSEHSGIFFYLEEKNSSAKNAIFFHAP